MDHADLLRELAEVMSDFYGCKLELVAISSDARGTIYVLRSGTGPNFLPHVRVARDGTISWMLWSLAGYPDRYEAEEPLDLHDVRARSPNGAHLPAPTSWRAGLAIFGSAFATIESSERGYRLLVQCLFETGASCNDVPGLLRRLRPEITVADAFAITRSEMFSSPPRHERLDEALHRLGDAADTISWD